MPEPVSFQAPKGTFDVLPPRSAGYERLVVLFASLVERAGYGLVISPMFEDIAVFQRVGESTEVVRKEMYDFEDKAGRHLALRPEGTASVVRAWIEHRPPLPFKAWYVAPSFRYEAPQAGRFRQHHQLGVEVLGTDDPDVDVEVIALLMDFVGQAGAPHGPVRINSLGDGTCRPAYRTELEAYLDAHAGELCAEHRAGYAANPLRVLDCKRPECVAATQDAPFQVDHLCGPCQEHFDRVRAGLDALGVPYGIDKRLVRGLDYYTRTTFELAAEGLDAAQNALGGGGRYGGLTEELGGPPTPGIGFGIGLERMLLACGDSATPGHSVAVFVVDTTGGAEARQLTHALRAAGISADRAWDQRSLKAQLKAADRSGAQLALVIGPDEVERGVVALKPLRGGGAQEDVRRAEIIEQIRKRT